MEFVGIVAATDTHVQKYILAGVREIGSQPAREKHVIRQELACLWPRDRLSCSCTLLSVARGAQRVIAYTCATSQSGPNCAAGRRAPFGALWNGLRTLPGRILTATGHRVINEETFGPGDVRCSPRRK
jgi:hypothetical protein